METYASTGPPPAERRVHWQAYLVMMFTLLLAAPALHAADPWTDSYRFFGRWDRRAAHRAVTVNSGSYILARFTGASLSATFDVSVNQPPFPTLVWRMDEGEWQEAEVAATVKLAEGLASGPHTVMLMARGLDEHQRRWTKPLVASLKAAVDACQAAGDAKVYYVDTTGWYNGDVHPHVAGSAVLAGKLARALQADVLPK